jgi:hypothetical protein
MARPKKTAKPKSNVVPMSPEPAENVAAVDPEPESEPEAFQPPPAPPKVEVPAPKPKHPNFFQRVAAVPKADWGTRAFIYVYCLEPICDLRRGGENKYLVRLSEPLADEQSLMVDYGSGKYRLQFVHRKPAADKSDAVDTIEIEIYNPKYPPKIPQKVWMNDPRNERWAALLPKEEPIQPPTPLGSITDAFQTFTAIRKDLREEINPPAPPAPPVAPSNSMSDTLQLVNTIMTMKADNPMGEMYKDEMRALRDEMKAERDENRKLQAELRQTANVKTGFNLEEFIDKSDTWMPKLKGLLNLGGDKLTEIAHGRPRQWWQELLLDIAPPLISNLAPTIPMMIGAFTAPAIRPAANGMNGQQQPQAPAALPAGQPAQTNPMQALQMKVGGFLGANIKPVGKFFEDFVSGKLTDPSDPESKTDGVDFAMWVCDYHGEEILKDARALGSAQIMQMFRQSPYWIHMQKNEAKLAEFLDQALQYSPEAEPEPEGPIDLSGGQDA